MLNTNTTASAAAEQDDLAETVARLKKEVAEIEKAFFDAGTEWAKREASSQELRALARHDGFDWDQQVLVLDQIATDYQYQNGSSLWAAVPGEELDLEPSENEKDKFVEGALSVWYAVKERVAAA